MTESTPAEQTLTGPSTDGDGAPDPSTLAGGTPISQATDAPESSTYGPGTDSDPTVATGSDAQAADMGNDPAIPTGADSAEPGSAPVETEASSDVPDGSQEPAGGSAPPVAAPVEADPTPIDTTVQDQNPAPLNPAPRQTPSTAVIEIPGAGETVDSNAVVISGTVENGDGGSVTLVIDGSKTANAPVDNTGNWQAEVHLENGEHKVSATASIDGAVAQTSEDVTFEVDAPAGGALPADTSDDPQERFLAFLKRRIMKDYPLTWEFVQEFRTEAKSFIDHLEGKSSE